MKQVDKSHPSMESSGLAWENVVLYSPDLCASTTVDGLCQTALKMVLSGISASKGAIVFLEDKQHKAHVLSLQDQVYLPTNDEFLQANQCILELFHQEASHQVTFFRIAEQDELCCFPVLHAGSVEAVFCLYPPLPDGFEQLLLSVSQQVEALWSSIDNYLMLEELVAQEMATVVEREEAIHLILDSMSDGLLVCDLKGYLTKVRSRSVLDWFGEPKEGLRLWEYLLPHDKPARQTFALGFEQMVEDWMPFDVSVAQIPNRFKWDYRYFRLGFDRVEKNGSLAEIVVTISDISSEVVAERAEQMSKELSVIVGHLVNDRSGFLSALDNMQELLGRLSWERDASVIQRLVHTLKGNASVLGFGIFAKDCHELEEKLADYSYRLNSYELQKLENCWNESLKRIGVFIEQDKDKLFIFEEEYAGLLERLIAEDNADLADEVKRWKNQPIKSVLSYVTQQVPRLASSQGKTVQVEVDDGGLRLPSSAFGSFFQNLIHSVRNAISHGIESPEERELQNKTPKGLLRIQVRSEPGIFEVIVEDDGRGIDWEKIRARALEMGLPGESKEDLEKAIWAEGFTTAESINQIAGRGIGLPALAEACQRLNGRVSLQTEKGLFTRWTFTFPNP